MKLVLREYIAALKEDRELDSLVSNVLTELDIVLLTTPQKGRQYGVDIAAAGNDFDNPDSPETLFLIAVKQGNINRTNWDAAATGVRTTLTEIRDVYLKTSVPDKYKNIPKKIILVSNGAIEQNVNINWVGYINENTTENISYEYWGIEKLILLAEKAQFSEILFPQEIQSLLRKSLALLDVSEYDYRHFYQLVQKILIDDELLSKKEIIKKIRLLNSCLAIVFHWAKDYDNIKPALVIAERVILNTWYWIEKRALSLDPAIVKEYFAVLYTKDEIDFHFFTKIKDALLVEDGLAYTSHLDHIEYCLLTYEQIGIISTMGLTKLWYADLGLGSPEDIVFQNAQHNFLEAEVISDYLCHLIKNNRSSLYPKFDEHSIEINLALILLFQTDRHQAAVKWLEELISYISLNYRINKFFPLFVTDYEKLAEASATTENKDPESSMLITVLAEWCFIFNQPDLYHNLVYLADEHFKDINLQLWFPDNDTEKFFYIKSAMHGSGQSKTSIKLYKNHKEYLMEMTEERSLWQEEFDMSSIKNGVLPVGYIAFRHFRTYVFPFLWRIFLNSPFCFNVKPKTNLTV